MPLDEGTPPDVTMSYTCHRSSAAMQQKTSSTYAEMDIQKEILFGGRSTLGFQVAAQVAL